MAEVFLARDERLNRDVAVKVLRPDKAGDGVVRRRFAAEGRAVAGLSHPNVVGVFDFGEDGGNPYLVMELVTGGTLAERIGTGPLSEDEVRRVGLDILAGLGAAHAAGIVHRDVKPANVLMDEGGTAKLADFGIARADQPAGDEETVTAMVIGTPSYLAPERVSGAPATVRSDLWAVGVVLYEAATGVRPFQGATPFAAALAARSGDTTPLRERRPDVGPVVAAVVNRALSPDPVDRFPSAAAMAAALEQGGERDRWAAPAAADTSTLALLSLPSRPPQRPPARRGAARVWARLAVATAVGLLAVVLAWTTTSDGHASGTLTVPNTTAHALVPTTGAAQMPTTTPAQVPTTAAAAQAPTTVAILTSPSAADVTPATIDSAMTVPPPPVHAGVGRLHGKGHGKPAKREPGRRRGQQLKGTLLRGSALGPATREMVKMPSTGVAPPEPGRGRGRGILPDSDCW